MSPDSTPADSRAQSTPARNHDGGPPGLNLREFLDSQFPPLRLHGIEAVGRATESTFHQVWPPDALARIAAAPPRVKPPRLCRRPDAAGTSASTREG